MQPSLLSRFLTRAAGAGFLGCALALVGQEKVDVDTIERIKTEVEEHSQVMDTASWLTDVYGPRLTGSPLTKAAGDWAVARMRSWGLSNVHLESWGPGRSVLGGEGWGPLDRGWTSERLVFRAVTPYPFIINAVPSVWSPGTKGRVTGPAIRFEVHSFADLQQFAGKLTNAFLLMDSSRPTPAHFEPQARRLIDADLETLAAGQPLPRKAVEILERRYNASEDPGARRWLVKEGVAALLFTAPGDGGTIVMGGPGGAASRKKNEPDPLPMVKVGAESYGRIARILEKNLAATLELDMQNTFYDEPHRFNVIAEIPGTDPKLKDEVVMIGAHLDSWTFGTGATDNAAGSAVMMEAMRILKSLNLQPRRTIRIALWTGEELGGLGSSAYVRQHFRDSGEDTSTPKPEYESFSVYFNLDGGTGKIRGIGTRGNSALGPIFGAWMEPFNDFGMKTLTPRGPGGSDHMVFEMVGLPAFGFVQDPIEYNTRTHHTSADVYERLQPDDLKFNAAVLASFAWQAAQRDEKMLRVASRP